MKFLSLKFAIKLIWLGIAVIALSLILLLPFRDYFLAQPVDNALIGQFGDFIGGIAGSLWALAGVIMFYVALHEQRNDFKTNREILSAQLKEFKLQQVELAETRKVFKEQSETLRVQRFENSFFNMVDLLNEIFRSIAYDERQLSAGSIRTIQYTGRDAFLRIYYPIEEEIRLKLKSAKNLEEASEYLMEHKKAFDETENAALPIIKVFLEIIHLIFDSQLGAERKRYMGILKSCLDPFQFSFIALYLIIYNEKNSDILSKIQKLNFYEADSFKRLSLIKFGAELFELKLRGARKSIN